MVFKIAAGTRKTTLCYSEPGTAAFGTVDAVKLKINRSHLKKKILVQNQGGAELQSAGILKYSEELKKGLNTEFGPKDFFEIASKKKGWPDQGHPMERRRRY